MQQTLLKVRSLFFPPDFPDDDRKAVYAALSGAPGGHVVLNKCVIVTGIDDGYGVARDHNVVVMEVD